jgi:uncharacterized membrane protein YcaP (DUF421 family)
MDKDFHVFDFHRIFLGDTPYLFLLEIIFRTLVMYAYTVLLLRILGKRGMGQLSMLELAIIISFGSAVGDPMVGANTPILHGIVAITVITIFQISLERLINKNKKVEAIMEGKPNLVVNEGVIKWECLIRDNLSKEDLFRALRSKDVQQLGEIDKAFFETSGQISVMFQPPRKVKPGLPVLPEETLEEENIVKVPDASPETGIYCCSECGTQRQLQQFVQTRACDVCEGTKWVKAQTSK